MNQTPIATLPPDALTTLPDLRFMAVFDHPWRRAIKARGPAAWREVEPLVSIFEPVHVGQLPFAFAEWVACVLALCMMEVGEEVTAQSLVRHMRSQGADLLAVPGLQPATRQQLIQVTQVPGARYARWMEDPIALL